MDAARYFQQHPYLALLHVAALFFAVGVVVGWLVWAANRKQIRSMQRENKELTRDLEEACTRQVRLERKTSLAG